MIYFRDTLSRGGTRLPDFLVGCKELQRVQTDEGDVVTTGDPLFIDPPKNGWVNIGTDGWQVVAVGDLDLDKHVRARKDITTTAVTDPSGRVWHVPIIFDNHFNCMLPLGWGKENGIRVRKPNPEQETLINVAKAARSEFAAKTIGNVPIDIAGDWVYRLLESTYHLSGDVIDALGLMTDELAAWVLIKAAGTQQAASDV